MNNFILVLGGARSGKSRHAENLIKESTTQWRYVATGRARDEEMQARIALHRAEREAGWETVEAPLDIVPTLACDRPVLVDCLTLWLTNLLLEGCDVERETERLLAALRQRGAMTVLVGNEVGLSIVPENVLARRFRDEAGLLHQRLGREARRVLFVVAGHALDMK